MKTTRAAAVLMLAIGCGSDTGASRLAPGSDVVLMVEAKPGEKPLDSTFLVVREGDGDYGGKTLGVPAGTRAVVVSDSDPDRPRRGRHVLVKVDEGKHLGAVGTILRGWVRPVAK